MQEEIGSRSGWLWPIIGAIAIFSLPAGLLFGQPVQGFQFGEPQEVEDLLLVPAPREWRQELLQAEQAIAAGQFADAVTALGTWLIDAGAQGPQGPAEDYFLEADPQTGRVVGIREMAERLIGQLPPAGRQMYELQFGAAAKRLLDQALEQRRADVLVDVVRQYFHTQAGRQAALLLARTELDRGRPAGAIRWLEKIRQTSPVDKSFEPQIVWMLASAWQLLGRDDRATEELRRLLASNPDATLTVGGQARPFFQRPGAGSDPAGLIAVRIEGGEAEFDLEALRALGEVQWARRVFQWTMPAGSASRNAFVDGSMPLWALEWEVPATADQSQRETLQQLVQRAAYQGEAMLPVFVPLVVDRWVIMRALDTVYGIDFATGKRVWHFPWDGSSLNDDTPQRGRRRGEAMELRRNVWQDAILGQVSSDGERLFVIMPDRSMEEGPEFRTNIFQLQTLASYENSTTQLFALDLAAEGKLLWVVGGMRGGNESRLAETFFLGTPIAHDGRLYAIAEHRGELKVVVLDPETGRLLWSQQLLHVGARVLDYDPLRRQVGAVPSLSNGVLVCPTTAGYVVAVDIHTRRLLWVHQYESAAMGGPTISSIRIPRGSVYLTPTSRAPGERWLEAAATMAGDRVVVTPPDSNSWYCLDLFTGEAVGPARPRGKLLMLVTVRPNAAVFLGASELAAFDLEKGEALWATPLGDGVVVTGRPVVTEDHLYVPTSTPELVQIELATGKIVARAPSEERLGNLVSAGGFLVSQGPGDLKVFYQKESLAREIQNRLEARPDDPWGLFRQGLLKRDAGALEEAIDSLRRCLANMEQDDPRRARVEVELMGTLLTALESSETWNDSWWEQADQLQQRPDQRLILQRLLVRHLIDTEKFGEAFDIYLDLAHAWIHQEGASAVAEASLDRMASGWQVGRDRWLRAGIREILQKCDPQTRGELERRLVERFVAVASSEVPLVWSRYWAVFAALPGSHAVAQKLARQASDDGRLVVAEHVAMNYVDAQDLQQRSWALATLAKVYLDAHRPSLVRTVLDRLREPELASVRLAPELLEATTVAEFIERADEKLALLPTQPRTEWPAGKTQVTHSTRTSREAIGVSQVLSLDAKQGVVEPGVQIVLNSPSDRPGISALVGQLVDGDGRELSRFPIAGSIGPEIFSGMSHWQTLGHLGVVSFGHRLHVFDWLSPKAFNDRMLWAFLPGEQLDLPDDGQRARLETSWNVWGDAQHRLAVGGVSVHNHDSIAPDGLAVMALGELVCMDPWTGEPAWRRRDVELGSWVWGDSQRVFVAAPDATEARVFQRLDGREVGTRPVPAETRRWATFERCILTWDGQATGNRRLQLWDPWEQTARWTMELPRQTRGCLVGGGQLGLLEPGGKLRIVDLATGRAVVQLQVPIEREHPEQLQVLRMGRDYLVIGNSHGPQGRSRPAVANSMTEAYNIDGWLWMVSANGTPLWQVPAVIDGYEMPLPQPVDAPVLVLFRQIAATSGRQPPRVQMLCLDRRDGRMLASASNVQVPLQGHRVEVDANSHAVSIHLLHQNQSHVYRVQFSDEPRPPEPPVQLGDASSLNASRSANRAWRVMGSVLDALGRQTLRLADPDGVLEELGDDLAPQGDVPELDGVDIVPLPDE